MLQTLHYRCQNIAQATLVLRMDMFQFHADYMRWMNGIIKILFFSDAKIAISLFLKHNGNICNIL